VIPDSEGRAMDVQCSDAEIILVGTVKSRLFHARRVLSRQLADLRPHLAHELA